MEPESTRGGTAPSGLAFSVKMIFAANQPTCRREQVTRFRGAPILTMTRVRWLNCLSSDWWAPSALLEVLRKSITANGTCKLLPSGKYMEIYSPLLKKSDRLF